MSTEFDIAMKAVAEEMMSEFGKNGQIEASPSVTYDPDEGDTNESTPVKHNVKYVPPFPASRRWGSTTMKEGDFETYVLPAVPGSFKLDNGIKVKIDLEWWKVVEFNPIYSGEDIALFGLLLRK